MSTAASEGYKNRCRIAVDTCSDLTPEIAATLDVDILGFPYILDGVEKADDIWTSMTPKWFYDQIRSGVKASTAAISVGRYLEYFTECAEEGTPTVYLAFTSALSSSYSTRASRPTRCARSPRFRALRGRQRASLRVRRALGARGGAPARTAGLTAAQLAEWANESKTYVHGYFTLDSLDSLAAGGRIPPAAAQISSKLDIKANLSFDLSGSLTLTGVNRGRKKALKSLVKAFKENYVLDPNLPMTIVTSDCEKDGDWLESAIRKEPGCANLTIIRGAVGPTIGAHVGPGMVAVIFWGKNRADKASLTDRIAKKVRRGHERSI